MKITKRVSLILAAILSLTVLSTACGKDVTSSSEDPAAETTAAADGTTASDDLVADASGDPASDPEADTTVKPAEVHDTTKLKYGYSTLTPEEKKIYDDMVTAVSQFKSSVELEKPIPHATYAKIFGMVYFQEAQLFWLLGRMQTLEKDMDKIPLSYRFNSSEVAAMQKEIDAKVKELEDSLPANATDMDKMIIFHDYIVLNNQFTKEGDYVQTVYGALVDGKIQCEGYAKAIAYLCDRAGIENLLITGTNSEQNSHAWNKVKLDGEWYVIDTTWDDPMGHEDNPQFIRYNYFGATDAEIIGKTHFPDTPGKATPYAFETPAATATKYNYFNYVKKTANTYDEAVALLKTELEAANKDKLRQVQIKVGSAEVLKELQTKMEANKASELFKILGDINNSASNKFNVSSIAPKADENCLTYQVGVKYA